jgi:hypothetical protein
MHPRKHRPHITHENGACRVDSCKWKIYEGNRDVAYLKKVTGMKEFVPLTGSVSALHSVTTRVSKKRRLRQNEDPDIFSKPESYYDIRKKLNNPSKFLMATYDSPISCPPAYFIK